MTTITLATPKGGAGKTTAAILLTCEIAKAGKSVVIIDADPRRHAARWGKRSGAMDKISIVENRDSETIMDTIEKAQKKADFVIVDPEGTASMTAAYAITRSDLVLIPTKASMPDIESAHSVARLIQTNNKAFNTDTPYRFVFTMIPAAIRSRNYKHIRRQLEAKGQPILGADLIEREAFRSVLMLGGSLYDLTHNDVSGLRNARANSRGFMQAVADALKHDTAQAA